MLKGFFRMMFQSLYSKEFLEGWLHLFIKSLVISIPIGLLFFTLVQQYGEGGELKIVLIGFLGFSLLFSFLCTGMGAITYWFSSIPNFRFLASKHVKNWCKLHQSRIFNCQFVHGQWEAYDYQMRHAKNIFLKTTYGNTYDVPKGVVVNLLAKCTQAKHVHTIEKTYEEDIEYFQVSYTSIEQETFLSLSITIESTLFPSYQLLQEQLNKLVQLAIAHELRPLSGQDYQKAINTLILKRFDHHGSKVQYELDQMAGIMSIDKVGVRDLNHHHYH